MSIKAIDQAVAASVLFVCMGGAAYLVSVAAVQLVPPVWESWSRNSVRIEAEEARGERIRLAGQETVFHEVCPIYLKESGVARFFPTMRWCEDFRERL